MSGYLTTHVLDTARGVPAAGMRVTLYRLDGDSREELAQMITNADGRTDMPILSEADFAPGVYELIFEAGDYLRAHKDPDSFLDTVPIRFMMTEATHYHVPLLLSPFAFSTYRGS